MHICFGKLISIGSDNGVSPLGATPLSEPMLECCWFEPRKKLQWNREQNSYIIVQENVHVFENVIWKMAAISCPPKCVNSIQVLMVLFFIYYRQQTAEQLIVDQLHWQLMPLVIRLAMLDRKWWLTKPGFQSLLTVCAVSNHIHGYQVSYMLFHFGKLQHPFNHYFHIIWYDIWWTYVHATLLLYGWKYIVLIISTAGPVYIQYSHLSPVCLQILHEPRVHNCDEY